MNIRNRLLIAGGFLFLANGAMAQSVDDGLKKIYYGNFAQAKQEFEKVVAAKPTDDRGFYYLGFSQLGLEDRPGAEATFQKGLTAIPNSPLLQVGLGRMDLIKGNAAAARQKFDAATAATNGKNGDVARAIADANTETKGGDRPFALATMLKLFDNTGIKKKDQYTPTAADYIELGDAYRFLGGENGGKAIEAYDKAIELDPKNAEAVMKQGLVNYNAKLLQAAVNDFTKATQVDPQYAPAYYELYQFYFTQKQGQFDLPKAKQYLQKYLEVADPQDRIKNEYFLSSIMFFDHDYAGAITKAQSLLPIANEGYKTKLTRLIADAYLQKGDSINAKKTMDTYVSTVGESKLEPLDYKLLSEIYSRQKLADSAAQVANDQKALAYLEKFASLDTTQDVDRIESVAKAFTNARVFDKAGDWYQKLVDFKLKNKENPTAIDYYNVGLSYYRASASEARTDTNMLNKADVAFAALSDKFPDLTTGYYWRGMANAGKDVEAKTGVALPYFAKYISMAEGDPAKNKAGLIKAYTYSMVYYYNKDDKAQMQAFMQKLEPLDPTSEALRQIKDIMRTPAGNTAPRSGTRSTGTR
ncbi:tetratricopeptide repeat protein [Chitinophaga skermanii]|uniref:Tetratricopeptide repeat protein n=1 Tax=Chitinophaga skermanii TaxID=331697 RepID=A0A327Q211_9BACT|nr:tetratricopeptide repeat protein [Chitinophaga skermanii]RAI98505.1 tetratricopeptide repeat protein [Chitinophaga skermanii]